MTDTQTAHKGTRHDKTMANTTPRALSTPFLALLLSLFIAPSSSATTSSSTIHSTSAAPSPILKAGNQPPAKIEPPTPKFKTTPDSDAPSDAVLDLDVLARSRLEAGKGKEGGDGEWWDDEGMVIKTGVFRPGMYQTRFSVGNGYVDLFSWFYFLVLPSCVCFWLWVVGFCGVATWVWDFMSSLFIVVAVYCRRCLLSSLLLSSS